MPGFCSNTDWQKAVDAVRNSRRIVVFSGAGISAESGIATFRDEGGFWQKFPPEDFANWQGIAQVALFQPRRLAEFLIAVLEPIASAVPNAAHQSVAALQQTHDVAVVTQNIDGLHQEAGSQTVRELHGSLLRVTTSGHPPQKESLTREQLAAIVRDMKNLTGDWLWTPQLLKIVHPLLHVGASGFRRPDVVLFGDALAEPDWSQAEQDVHDCDLLITVGTSGLVYPAALLPEMARERRVPIIGVDPLTPCGDIYLCGKAATVLSELVAASGQNVT
ncbi:MAG: iron dicitrate transport regulator FecR [Planctomycetaceae bacterium]|nr:iron dicitrate transport regulator FecR [Planctomycetaceae bacterium]